MPILGSGGSSGEVVAPGRVEPSRGEVVGVRGEQDPQVTMLAFIDLGDADSARSSASYDQTFCRRSAGVLVADVRRDVRRRWSPIHPTRAAAEGLAADQSV